MIDATLASLLEDGVGIHLGTRNERLEPNGARAIALKVERDGRHVWVYMAQAAAARVLPDLEANGQAAVVVARPTDDRACQVKGVFVGARQLRPDERQHARAQWNAFLTNLEHIGIPRAAVCAWHSTPDLAIRLRATAIFEQTPGPSAGAAIA